MTNDAHERHTANHNKRPGIPPTWRNANGSYPRNPKVDERDRRVDIIRGVLRDKPDATAVDIVLGFRAVGVVFTLATAERYLARARGEM